MPIGLLDLAKEKNIKNRDKSKITKHLIFPICFCQTLENLLNSKLISKLVSSDTSVVFCVL